MTPSSAPPKVETPEQSSATAMADPAQVTPSASASNQPQATEKSETEATVSNSQAAAVDTITPSTPEPASEPAPDSPVISKETIPPSTPAKNDGDASPPAIEEATNDEATKANPAGSNDEGPICVITLLVTSGKKHPYKIDEKYLTKRNVHIPGTTESGHKDPFSISVYTLKELILREWRDEWEPKPSSPTLIRLIHFGKLLADKDPLNRKPLFYFSAIFRETRGVSLAAFC